METYLLTFVTTPDVSAADRIAQALVTERLAACVSIVPGLTSVYRWKGELQRDSEVLLIIKTTRHRFEDLRMRVKELHPYEVPEIIATALEAGDKAYLDWIGDMTL